MMSLTSPILTSDRPVSFTMSEGSPAERIEPLTLDLVKKQVRNLTTSEDDLLAIYLAAVRMMFEEQTTRQLIDAVWEYGLSRAPRCRSIELPRPPLSGDVTITYDDANSDPQTFDSDNYVVESSFLEAGTVDPHCQPGRITLATGAAWPITNGLPGSLRIRRTCGYGDVTEDVPALIQSALLLLFGHLHRNRAEVQSGQSRAAFDTLPLGAQAMIFSFKYTALTTTPLV